MKSRERILYSLLLMLIVISSGAMLRSVIVVCDHVSHTSNLIHHCCSCSEHRADCATHSQSVEHKCANQSVELLEYIVPKSQCVNHNVVVTPLLLANIDLSSDTLFSGDDPSYTYWIRNDLLYDDPIYTQAQLRAPPTLV